MLHLHAIANVLRAKPPEDMTAFSPQPQHASVALALAGMGDDLHLCFIRRVERTGDPWSGHMALPGGRADAKDVNPQAVAARESAEEVNLILTPSMLLAALPKVEVSIGDTLVGLTLWPFVYYVGRKLLALKPQPSEVARAYWIPLAHLWNVENHTKITRTRSGDTFIYAGIAFQGETIWGLTHRVLHGFSQQIKQPIAGAGGAKIRI